MVLQFRKETVHYVLSFIRPPFKPEIHLTIKYLGTPAGDGFREAGREAKQKKFEKGCEYYGKNKGKHSGQVPRCNFYFVALLAFLVKRFSLRSQFPNSNILGTCPNLVPRVLSLPRESTLVTAGHVSMHANSSRTEGGSST